MRKKAITSYVMSRCKPGATSKDLLDTVAPFLSSKSKSRRHIITDTQNVYDIFADLFLLVLVIFQSMCVVTKFHQFFMLKPLFPAILL